MGHGLQLALPCWAGRTDGTVNTRAVMKVFFGDLFLSPINSCERDLAIFPFLAPASFDLCCSGAQLRS